MKRYILLYLSLIKFNLLLLLEYRASLYGSLLSSLMWGVFSVISVVLATYGTKEIFGWKRDEIILLSTSYSIVVGLYHAVFARNMGRFADLVFFGNLDGLLLKPVDSQFAVSLWLFHVPSLLRVVFGIGSTIYVLHILQISLSLLQIMIYIVLTLGGVMMLYGIWFGATTIALWSPRLSNITDFLYNLTGAARYPQEMYRQLVDYVFIFLLPITLIVTTPTKGLLSKVTVNECVQMLVFSIVFLLGTRWFWKYALRHYASASS